MSTNGNGKKLVPYNCKVDDDFDAWFSKIVRKSGHSFSEVLRCCMMLGGPIIDANPRIVEQVHLRDLLTTMLENESQ